MKKEILLLLAIIFLIAVQPTNAEANFTASSLNASDVDCRKCHTAVPHIIHAQKPAATCEACHGDKLSVAIPQCTKCHSGTIHKVHAGKVSTQTCDYCHKTVVQVHINLTSGAVCSHCHKDLVEVHGGSEACVKCHKSAPDIVKPLKSPEMILICQNCHPKSSVATIHGDVDNKTGCYNCHKGASKMNGSEIPHNIHVGKASCQDCHQDNGKVVVPKCAKCHDIDTLHAFNKIGTKTSNLNCQICHPNENAQSTKMQTIPISPTAPINDSGKSNNASTLPVVTTTPLTTQGPSIIPTVPGFGLISGIVILLVLGRKRRM